MMKALMRVLLRVRDLVELDVILRLQILWYSWRVRRLSSEMPAEMALVVHAFQEERDSDQRNHLDLWFGYPTGPIPDDVSGPVCRCGATVTPMDKGRSVLAVYHTKSMVGHGER
jgi:hypothetical protein